MDMEPTAISESLNGTRAAFLGLRSIEASPIVTRPGGTAKETD